MQLKTSKTWMYLFQKPERDKGQLLKLKIDAKRDPLPRRIAAGLFWFLLSMAFLLISIYCEIYCFNSVFGTDADPWHAKWLTLENNYVVPFTFIIAMVLLVIFAFSCAMILWTYVMRKTQFVNESTIELIGRRGMF